MSRLYSYILGELLRTFGLTIVVLTGLFTLGGGLYNIVRYEGVTAADVLRILPLLLPIVITFTMPIGALFAATLVYGRLSADNELTACRAAGINVQRLFRPALLLAVFVTLVTVLSVNFLIPDFTRRIEWYARTNIRDYAFHHLRQRGYVRYAPDSGDQMLLTAQAVSDVSNDTLVAKGFSPTSSSLRYFAIEMPTFLWVDGNGELKQYASADQALCQFDTGGDQVQVSVYIHEGRNFEIGRPTALRLADQKIGPLTAPIRLKIKPSMADLTTLLRWRLMPWEFPELAQEIQDLRARLIFEQFFRSTATILAAGKSLDLAFDAPPTPPSAAGPAHASAAAARRCLLRAEEARLVDERPVLIEPRLTLIDDPAAAPIRYTAAEARVSPRGFDADGRPLLEIRLISRPDRPVLEYLPTGAHDSPPREKDGYSVSGLRVPAAAAAPVEGLSAVELLSPEATRASDRPLDEKRRKLAENVERLERRVVGIIHSRLGSAASTLVTIMMGAALGSIFLGARVLAAFGLACIPFFATLIVTLTGRQLTESGSGHALGPYVIWGGLALVGLTSLLLLRFGVRR